MTQEEPRLLVIVGCGATATCLLAALVTHNRTSTPLTLAEVLITALIPAGLLGYVTVYYRSRRVFQSAAEDAVGRQSKEDADARSATAGADTPRGIRDAQATGLDD